jgi:hypothetical protein
MDKNYLELALQDAGELDHKDLMLLIADLYKRLDALDALE